MDEATLARFLIRAKREVGLPGAVHLLVTSNREMQVLNRRFRGKNKATDVLSFPPLPGLVDGLAGDVAISAEMAAQNAKRLGHSLAEEIKVLALHGLLHLAGHDHETDGGQMERRENLLRSRLNLPNGLIQRTQSGETKKERAAGRSKPR